MKPDNLFDLTGKVAIVTGGNGGLGLGMALGLAGAGANIVVAAQNQAKTDQALQQIKDLGVSALGLKVDVAQESDVSRMVAQTIESLGRVDILVNNAGNSVRKQPQELSADDLENLEVMAGVSEFPMRVKCATLAWHAMKSALDGGGVAKTE